MRCMKLDEICYQIPIGAEGVGPGNFRNQIKESVLELYLGVSNQSSEKRDRPNRMSVSKIFICVASLAYLAAGAKV